MALVVCDVTSQVTHMAYGSSQMWTLPVTDLDTAWVSHNACFSAPNVSLHMHRSTKSPDQGATYACFGRTVGCL